MWTPAQWRLLYQRMLMMVCVGFCSASAAQASTDAVCASCHRAIYDAYEKTPMARGSGPADAGVSTGSFDHAPSSIRYSVEQGADGQVHLRYERTKGVSLKGSQSLAYFIGSGKRGRTYLFQTEGYWFQSPINYYTRSNTWEMAPGYASAHGLPIDLRVDEGCLSCHSSGVQPSQTGSTNHFGDQPFSQSGITCARCHGDATAHVASGGKQAILNPAKMEPQRRDAVCQQCHLEGDVSVLHAGTHPSDVRPGDRLFDKVSYFVHAQQEDLNVRAVSQVEALAQSVCKLKSGDAMTCTSCHDPHRTVAASEKVAWYRGRCLACHTGVKFVAQHYLKQPDCTGCHMPTNPTTDIAHEQATDHRIRKIQQSADIPLDETASRLVAVLDSKKDARELGLAYATFAKKGDLFSLGESVRLLKVAEVQSPDDAAVAFILAQLSESQGDSEVAASLYQKVYRLNPGYPGAEQAMGDLAARKGSMAAAITLWKHALDHDRADVSMARRLAAAQCAQGERESAIKTLEHAVPFSPDAPELRATVLRWKATEQGDCRIH